MHRLKVTAGLMLLGSAFMLRAIGFGLSLLTVWLQQLYGTPIAFPIVGGGSAAVALILFAVASRHPAPASPPRPVPHETAAPEFDAARRSFDEAIATIQHGPRETMVAALALAVVAGLTLARRH